MFRTKVAHSTGPWRAALALTLAYALFAQLLLASAAAAMAAGPGGNGLLLLCRPSATGPSGPQTPAHGYPACCVLGCPLAAPLAPPPDVGLLTPPRPVIAGAQALALECRPAPRPIGFAHRARAPPQFTEAAVFPTLI